MLSSRRGQELVLLSYQAQVGVRDASAWNGTKLNLTPRSLPADNLFIPSGCICAKVGRMPVEGTATLPLLFGEKRNVRPMNPLLIAPEGKEAYVKMSRRALIVDDGAVTPTAEARARYARGHRDGAPADAPNSAAIAHTLAIRQPRNRRRNRGCEHGRHSGQVSADDSARILRGHRLAS
jgi:hypothetical protein